MSAKEKIPAKYLRVARIAADDLLTSGDGKRAFRLELKDGDEKPMGGWGYDALVRAIAKVLHHNQKSL